MKSETFGTLKTEYRDQSILNIYLIEVKTSEVAKLKNSVLVIKQSMNKIKLVKENYLNT